MYRSLKYAYDVVNDDVVAPKYVKKQCLEFIEVVEDKNKKYYFNKKRHKNICKILKVLKMAKGPATGKSIYSALAGYQWLLIDASLCIMHRDDKTKRRYETILLEIARKNGKTFIVAVLFILLFYIEPNYSKFYSVAPDGSLAREIKDAIEPLLNVNEPVFDDGEWHITRDYILNKVCKTKYIPLNFSTSRMDAKEPNCFIADEVGALTTNYPIEAMQSGQLLVKNPLGFLISTKYPTLSNPLEDEVNAAKQVLDKIVEDDTLFALLYEPDRTDDWMEDDIILKHANPLAQEIQAVWDTLIKKRTKAILDPRKRENFLTKHCNIIYKGIGTESYVDIADVQKCCVEAIDWRGKDVYVGVDLSMTNDNTSVSFAAIENGVIYANSFAFVPAGRIDEKSKAERIDYFTLTEDKTSHVMACGENTIDYGFVEEFVFNLEDVFGVNVVQIGFDRYNALSSAQKWENGNGGMHKGYDVVEIKQHSSVLHPATKFLSEKIENGQFRYEPNKLLEINFQNARCTYDTNMNRYVNKKKSNGKVDMVVSLINATYLIQQDLLQNGDGFVSMVI